MRLIEALCVCLLVLIQGGTVFGQEGDVSETTATPSAEEESSVAAVSPAGENQSEIEALKKQMASMKEEQDAKLESMKEEYDARLDEMEMGDFETEIDNTEYAGIKVFGFYDLAFMWNAIEKKDTVFDNFINTSPQILLQHINLYFSSQMTQNLSFMTEIQHTFLPHGSSNVIEGERWDNTAIDPYTQSKITLGGLAIQRAWLKWAPWDFFGVKAGYFLTPYGIWHEDHGSPVRISIMPPFENDVVTPSAIRRKNPVPDGQLGLQLFGRLFPFESIYFDYAFTASNGRGPADTVIDYDDNKGVGLRLKLTYRNPKLEIAAGGYGYFGEYTDEIANGFNLDTIENYNEYVVATDLLVAFYGVRLQAEYIRNLIRFKEGGRIRWGSLGYSATSNSFLPDYAGNYFYFLLAYQLPLDRWLGNMTLSPYIGWEFVAPGEYDSDRSAYNFWFGLNFKPSRFVTLKFEGAKSEYEFTRYEEFTEIDFWRLTGQLAVSF